MPTLPGIYKNTDRNAPAAQTATLFKPLVVYPTGLATEGSQDFGPMVRFIGFEYKRGVQGSKDIGKKVFDVFLPCPGNITQSYVANWQQFDAGFEGLAADAAKSATGGSPVAGGLGALAAGAARVAVNNFGKDNKAIEFAKELMNNQQMKNVIANEAGYSINPRQEMTFNGMNLRTHAFQFKLVPKNNKENLDCLNIIRNFRNGMHSSYEDPLKVVLKYPLEVVIEFVQVKNGKLQRIPSIPTIPDCHITSFACATGTDSVTQTLHTDGLSTSYQISLSLAESVALSREDVELLDQLSIKNNI